MSTLRVAVIETADENTPLIIKTANASGPSLTMSAANDKIYLDGTLEGLVFPEVNAAVSYAYTSANQAALDAMAVAYSGYAFATATANDAANLAFALANNAANVAYQAADVANGSSGIAIGAFDQANTAYDTANTKASTGKAIAMTIVFG